MPFRNITGGEGYARTEGEQTESKHEREEKRKEKKAEREARHNARNNPGQGSQ